MPFMPVRHINFNLPDADIDDDGHTVSVWVKPDNTDTSFICVKTVFFDSGAGDLE